MRRQNAVCKIMLKCVESRASFIAVRGTVHLVKFIGKGCSISFLSAYVMLLSTTGYKVLKYSSQIHMASWPRNNRTNLYNFRFVLILVCFSPQIFCHRLAISISISIFSLAISVLEYYTANNVMSCFSAQRCFLPKTQSSLL